MIIIFRREILHVSHHHHAIPNIPSAPEKVKDSDQSLYNGNW